MVVNVGVPFFVLLGARAKRNPSTLLQVAPIVLAGRWLDNYLMVAPPIRPAPGFPVHAAAASVTLVAGMVLLYDRLAARE